ncbi:ABC transporter permease [Kitasatospora paranensis]|uniref:ABC transporter permease n=1 Tax=Kitasatospora paranensis TaxID=258053 RepID=A0ABW2G0B9_9ACTN
MSGLGKVVRSGVRHRRVQTLVLGLATTVAATASVLGGSLLAASNGPFDQAFARQRGAHLTAWFDAGGASAAQVAASAHAPGVSAAAGPFPTSTVDPQDGSELGLPAGVNLPPMTVVGRTDPGGAVDTVTLLQGSWASGPGQIVLSDAYDGPIRQIGTKLRFPGLPGDPTVTVVGLARSVSRTADAWVSPPEISALTAPGTPGGYQMLYRFTAAGTPAQLATDRDAVAAAVPRGAVSGTLSWLTTKRGTDRNTALFIPFLLAFGLLGILMSVLVVGNVVAGAVGTGRRRIGILKAVGFTPAQVVRSYMGQALIPASIGVASGLIAGNALAVPVLSTTAEVYGTATAGIAPWVDVAVAAGALILVTVTAWAAALQAGRLRTVDALAVGRAGKTGRGQGAARLAARLPIPRPVSLGLALPFARPARAAGMVAAIVFGTAATTFAVGMASSLNWVQEAKNHDTADVVIHTFGPPPGAGQRSPVQQRPATVAPTAISPSAITTVVTAQPGTGWWYGTADTDVTVAGVPGSTTVTTFTGDSSRAGYAIVTGRWFRGSGEAVVPATFLTATASRIGDTVTLHARGRAVPVRIVGEVFDPHTQTNEVLTDGATLSTAIPDLRPTAYSIHVEPRTNRSDYIDALNRALSPLSLTATASGANGSSDVIIALDSLTAALTLMLIAVAALGVLSTVVLQTRERVRDIGVVKALGMTPRQTIAMVLASVVTVSLAGGAIGLPAGLALHAATVPAMGHSAGLDFPSAAIHVLPAPELVLLGLGGLLIGIIGALIPAGWAARTSTIAALRTE